MRLLKASGTDVNANARNGAKLDVEAVQAKLQPGFLQFKPVPHEDIAALLRQLGAKEAHTHLPPWSGVRTPTITAQVP